jgi:hypothetical protein
MNDFKVKIDRLQQINEQMAELKTEKTAIEAEIIKQCDADLANTKLKSRHYSGVDAELTATNAESLKITYSSFLPFIFGKAYNDAVTETTTYKLSAPASRMLIGLWKQEYVTSSVADVLEQMPIDEDDRKQLLKKCKGKNYQKDVENIMKFTDMSYEDASEWAYLMSEAEIWQSFTQILALNNIDVSDEQAVNDIIDKIHAAFIVDESTKISVTKLGDDDA